MGHWGVLNAHQSTAQPGISVIRLRADKHRQCGLGQPGCFRMVSLCLSTSMCILEEHRPQLAAVLTVLALMLPLLALSFQSVSHYTNSTAPLLEPNVCF